MRIQPDRIFGRDSLRLDDREDLQNRRKPAIQLDKEPAVVVRQPDPAPHLAPQNDQLTAERRILSFKPALRLEWYGQESKKYTQQPEHWVSIGDSITPSTQIRFSVHTRVAKTHSNAENTNPFDMPVHKNAIVSNFTSPPPIHRRE